MIPEEKIFTYYILTDTFTNPVKIKIEMDQRNESIAKKILERELSPTKAIKVLKPLELISHHHVYDLNEVFHA